ncbi:MAG: non-canonical purine NTP pyrophosphatase [Christensenellales bacterium]
MKVLIATTNPGKISIYSTILSKLGIEWCSLKDFDGIGEVEETGETPRENSIIKAVAYNKLTHLPVIANDSGLVIKKFSPNDQPGVFVRRYEGAELSDQQMIDIFSQKLNQVGGKSKSHFDVSLTIIDENGKLFNKSFKSKCLMISTPSKTLVKGLPLRSLQYYKKHKKYMSEMTTEEANECEGKCVRDQEKFIKKVFKKKK